MYINASRIKDNLIITPKTRQKYLVIWSEILTFAPIRIVTTLSMNS